MQERYKFIHSPNQKKVNFENIVEHQINFKEVKVSAVAKHCTINNHNIPEANPFEQINEPKLLNA